MCRSRGLLVVLLTAFPAGSAEPPAAKPSIEDAVERLGKIAPDEQTIDFLATIDPRTGLPTGVRDRDPAVPIGNNHKPLPGGLIHLNAGASAGANYHIAFSPDGRTLVTGHCSGAVRLWDPVTGLSRGRLRNCHDNLFSLAFSPDGKVLAVAVGRHPSYRSRTHRLVKLFDLAAGEEIRRIESPGSAHRIAFAPDGKTLAVGGLDGGVQLHPLAPEGRVHDIAQGPGQVVAVAFSPDGNTLLVWYEKDNAHLYDTTTGKERASIPLLGRLQGHVAFSADGRRVALGNEEDIRVWDLRGEVPWASAARALE